MSGRLDETGRDEALRQLERAAGRLGDLAQQSSDVAAWLQPHEDDTYQLLPVSNILERAALGAAAPDLVKVTSDPVAGRLCVRTREPRALSAAFSSVIDATSREQERRGTQIAIAARPSGDDRWCDVIVGPPSAIDGFRINGGLADGENKFNFEGGGLGLHLILGAVVLDAHGGSLWAAPNVRGVAGVRLPVAAGN